MPHLCEVGSQAGEQAYCHLSPSKVGLGTPWTSCCLRNFLNPLLQRVLLHWQGWGSGDQGQKIGPSWDLFLPPAHPWEMG